MQIATIWAARRWGTYRQWITVSYCWVWVLKWLDDNQLGWLGAQELMKKIPVSQRLMEVYLGIKSLNQLTDSGIHRLKSVLGEHRIRAIRLWLCMRMDQDDHQWQPLNTFEFVQQSNRNIGMIILTVPITTPNMNYHSSPGRCNNRQFGHILCSDDRRLNHWPMHSLWNPWPHRNVFRVSLLI